MKTAIRPDFYFKTVPSLQDADDKATKLGATEEEKALFAMSQGAGWKFFAEYLERLYRELGDTNKAAIAAGADLEDIGRNTVVITLTQDIIDKIINKVSDAKDACTNDEQLWKWNRR